MIELSWEYEFFGKPLFWWVSGVFLLFAIGAGLILPPFIQPTWSGVEKSATVVRIESDDDGMLRPVFAVADSSSTFASSIWSNRSTYQQNEIATIVTDPKSDRWYIKGDRDATMAVLILRILAGIFGLIGGTVMVMTLMKVDDKKINLIGGVMGALSFGIPATFVLPGLLVAHANRPNMLFAATDAFGTTNWVIGTIFSVLGIATCIGTRFLYRYQSRTGEEGWFWTSNKESNEE